MIPDKITNNLFLNASEVQMYEPSINMLCQQPVGF